MSDPSSFSPSEASRSPEGTSLEFRRSGGALGVEYEMGLRARTLSDERASAAPVTRGERAAMPPTQRGHLSADAERFADAIRDLSGELEAGPFSPVRLNHATSQIDHLRRRLHGLGWIRDHEIGGCLSAAVRELSQARLLREGDRVGAVRNAILRLDGALAHTAEGLHAR